MANVRITSNLAQVKSLYEQGAARGLNVIGIKASEYAARETPVDTSNLRQSMTYAVDNNTSTVYVGTNVEYGVYVELGTGIYASEGNGRKDPWMVVPDGSGKYKEPFWTVGMKPHHMLKKSIENHLDEYKDLLSASIAAKFK